ncbi:hypothetical protein SFV1gp18 [Sulfolobus filamentous virus 1]|uniref:Uncharacterized protein n=2 Tax=Alphalipothrixvirus beppuense TaxID=2734584 RepID=A0A346LU57_SUFV1|nr:hypothetical protein HOT91_gp18 [Sulfolobus filamentous virus 1]AXQ00100.1 hypothetical protein SFV1gp18 [Sulfolobus filamentous virus 1]AZI75720.1 hypothetical protein SBFV1_gp19 [Sulfolobales Beppu filamentous phage 1]
MFSLFSRVPCLLTYLYLMLNNEEYVDERVLVSIAKECNVDVNLSIKLLINMGVLKPYRPGIYKVQRFS